MGNPSIEITIIIFFRNVPGQLPQYFLGFGTLQGNLGDIIGNIFKHHFSKFMIQHPPVILFFIGSIYDDKILLSLFLIYNQVIHCPAHFIAHRAVSCLAVCHTGKIIGQHPLQILKCISSLTDYFSHMGNIKQPCSSSNCHMLLYDSLFILNGKKISGKRDHFAMILPMHFIKRCFSFHVLILLEFI